MCFLKVPSFILSDIFRWRKDIKHFYIINILLTFIFSLNKHKKKEPLS